MKVLLLLFVVTVAFYKTSATDYEGKLKLNPMIQLRSLF